MARILVVDDEPVIRELVRVILEDAGHELVEAGSGEEALALAGRERFDAVLLDVTMRGIDGYETLVRLHRLPAFSTPVIMVTGSGDTPGRIQEALAGAIEHVPKPFEIGELLRTLDQVLALSDEERAARRKTLVRGAEAYGAATRIREGMTEVDPPRHGRRMDPWY